MPEPYPGLDLESRQLAVDTLIDVRDVPWSHKRDFAKSKLDAHLAHAAMIAMYEPPAV